MDGVHDMGGMDGFGPVRPEPNEPVFHEPWEARMLAMMRAMGATGLWTIDTLRFSRERLRPDLYLAASYYQRWLLGLEQLLVDGSLVAPDELAAGHALRPAAALPLGPFRRADVPRVAARGSFSRPATSPARFSTGERVRARNIHPRTHTRLPRYARGKAGVVERIEGCHVFPDAAATGRGEIPQWLYTVAFDSRELWGADADPTLTVSIEAFEPYLEPA
ncbi:MAG: nitrile hydratase subunit beta [Burkholderiales bacterium]|nr:nitrile hydratase subunit beta [Burkholderiales bacterium]